MRKPTRKSFLALVLVLAMLAGLSVPAMAAEEESKTITILQTSDLHGMINPFDYASNKESKTSLAHAAAIIQAERAKDPDLLLLDTGDTVQANYIQSFLDEVPHPAMAAFNYLDPGQPRVQLRLQVHRKTNRRVRGRHSGGQLLQSRRNPLAGRLPHL